MKDLLDVHMHTIASGHAYSSLREMITAGKARGLKLMGFSEHAPKMPGTCSDIYFCNFHVIRPEAFGIELLMGAELNIMDFSGKTDITPLMRKHLDYAIASLHDVCIAPGTKEQNTAAVIGAMQDPLVKIIGHPDNGLYPLDYEAVVQAAKENHVLLELNNSSYRPGGSRQNSREIGRTMLEICQRHNVSVIMDSDAHIDLDAGSHEYSLALVKEIGFPEELIVNTSLEAFHSFL